MAEITALDEALMLTGDEHLPIVQGNDTKRATMGSFRDLIVPFLQYWYKGETGDAGPAAAFRRNLVALKAAAITDGKSDFDGSTWFWREGDYSTTPNSQIDRTVVKANSTALSVGAWVRQAADAIVFGRRTVGDRLADSVSLLDRAVGDNTANDGPALRALIASLGVLGNRVELPRRVYKIDAVDGAGLVIEYPVDMRGAGSNYTSINPALASANDDTIVIRPHPGYDHSGVKWSDLAIGNPFDGSRIGDNGLVIETFEPASNIGGFQLENVSIGAGTVGGYAFVHKNDTVANVNGGMFTATFANVRFKGGITFDGSGDSNRVLCSTITGSNIGLDVNLVKGASCLAIEHCNITTSGGIFRLGNGSRFRWINNNCENYKPGVAEQNDGALINITGASGTIVGGLIQGGLVSAFGESDATHLIKLQNCRGTVIENVTFAAGYPIIGIEISNTCIGVVIGENQFNVAVTTRIIDNGVGTIGVVKYPTLKNGWTSRGPSEKTLQIIKDRTGTVRISGSVADGVSANGTVVATLPVGFRPSEVVRFGITGNNSGTPVMGEMSVDTAGDVRILFIAGSQYFTCNAAFSAEGLANAPSPE